MASDGLPVTSTPTFLHHCTQYLKGKPSPEPDVYGKSRGSGAHPTSNPWLRQQQCAVLLCTADDNCADVMIVQDCDVTNVTLTPISDKSCDMRLSLRLEMSQLPNRVDGLVIRCTHCEHDQPLRLSVRIDQQPSRTVCMTI